MCVIVCDVSTYSLALVATSRRRERRMQEGLVDHSLHLGEGPQEQQVLVDSEDLPAYLETCHLVGVGDGSGRKEGG